MRFALLVPAAGLGARLGKNYPKALIELEGEPLFVRAVRPFLGFADCVEVVIAAPADYLERFVTVAGELNDTRVRVISGGFTRQDSVGKALDSLRSDSEVVLVHDAARAMISPELVSRVLAGLDDSVAAVLPGLAAVDTLKMLREDSPVVERTLPRERIYAVQTPQLVRRDLFIKAHAMASKFAFTASDDVGLIEQYNLGQVRVIDGDAGNFKITTPEDLERARSILSAAETIVK